jgi:hypothetical protein
MRALGLLALAVATIGVVVFVFVELHAAKAPATSPATSPSPPASSAVEPPVVSRPLPPAATTPTVGPDLSDPMDRVVQGKTRREWRTYFAAQQRRILADLDRYQEIIDDSSDGKEHDWAAVKDAHQRVRELRERMKQDLEELSRIENAP